MTTPSFMNLNGITAECYNSSSVGRSAGQPPKSFTESALAKRALFSLPFTKREAGVKRGRNRLEVTVFTRTKRSVSSGVSAKKQSERRMTGSPVSVSHRPRISAVGKGRAGIGFSLVCKMQVCLFVKLAPLQHFRKEQTEHKGGRQEEKKQYACPKGRKNPPHGGKEQLQSAAQKNGGYVKERDRREDSSGNLRRDRRYAPSEGKRQRREKEEGVYKRGERARERRKAHPLRRKGESGAFSKAWTAAFP